MASDGIRRIHLPEQHVPGKRLGRHVEHDPRSKDFPADRAAKIVSVTHASAGLPLEQGSIGCCTADALCGALDSAPNFDGVRLLGEKDAISIYELETQYKGEPYPPNDPGGTGLLACKAARQRGLITSYRHAFGIQHALEALVLRPVITGVSWYPSFDTPDPSGLVTIPPGATSRGGHEIVAHQIDAGNQLVWFWNSWGTRYGVGGRFCMSFGTWERLLDDDGDVTVPIV